MTNPLTQSWQRQLFAPESCVGRVTGASMLRVDFVLPGVSLGDRVSVQTSGGPRVAEVVQVNGKSVTAQWTEGCAAVRAGSTVRKGVPVARGIPLSPLAGRVVRVAEADSFPESTPAAESVLRPAPQKREPSTGLHTGVAALDAMLPLIRGQRTVLMAGSGVGKSSLLRLLAETWHGRVVLALIGEREREVLEWNRWLAASHHLAIAETASSSIAERLQSLPISLQLAQSAAAAGEHVLLLVDSMTRWARAAVQVTDPSASPRTLPLWVRERLAQFVEHCGQFDRGSITLVMAVLVERDDVHDPLADELRSLTDAHWVLDRGRSEAGVWPPLDLTRSVTRLGSLQGGSETHWARNALRQVFALVERSRDAVELGVYRTGESAELDVAIQLERAWAQLAQRTRTEPGSAERELLQLMQRWASLRSLSSSGGSRP